MDNPLSVCRMNLEVPMFRRTLAVVTGLTMVSVDVHAPAGHRPACEIVSGSKLTLYQGLPEIRATELLGLAESFGLVSRSY